ncbi:LOW QUALITY PROTEIN: hypothetical protein HID58_025137, partial [Brassica napus]
ALCEYHGTMNELVNLAGPVTELKGPSIRISFPDRSCVPSPEERVSNFIHGQIAVYEDFSDNGCRGVIPSLIATLCDFFEISPFQLYPPSWRLLLAIQNLGDLENLSFGLERILLFRRERILWFEHANFLLIVAKYLSCLVIAPCDVAASGVSVLTFDCFVLNTRSMSGDTSNDPFIAYQKAAKSMSAKKGSASRTVSGDDLMITGSRDDGESRTLCFDSCQEGQGWRCGDTGVIQSAEVVRSGNLAAALSNLNLQVFPHDGTTLPLGEPLEVIQVLQGGLLRNISQLHHLGEQLSLESSSIGREELEELKNQLLEEKAQRVARELEIHDYKDKIKDVERSAEISSADALSRKNDQWDLAKALAQYKTVVLVEAQNKGAPVPTFENEPTIPDSGMDIDLRPGGSSS